MLIINIDTQSYIIDPFAMEVEIDSRLSVMISSSSMREAYRVTNMM